MIFFLSFGILMLLLGLFYLWLALRSRNPKNLISVTGVLAERKGFKNVKIKNYIVKNVTDYVYSYEANGKRYLLKYTQYTHPRNILKRVTIVYLRGFPRIACIEHFSGATEWTLAILLILFGAFCVFISFYVA